MSGIHIIFSYFAASYSEPDANLSLPQKCRLLVKPGSGEGVMAYVASIYLRTGSMASGCLDYVQFGQDDIIPFITIRKSEKEMLNT